MTDICKKCGLEPVEDFGDGEPSCCCISCNSRAIDRSNRRLEWNYYHPGEPCPESEMAPTADTAADSTEKP